MEEVTCPRCKGTGDIPAPGGAGGVTKCFSCGGRGVINQQDLAWKSKWVETNKPEPTPERPAKAPAAKKTATKKVTKAKVVEPPKPTNGRTQLHQDASDGYVKGVAELLEQGAEVNARDDDGRTPLHWPAYRGHLEVVRLLVEHGADVNAHDNNGRTPLKMATIGNHSDVIAYLEEQGAER